MYHDILHSMVNNGRGHCVYITDQAEQKWLLGVSVENRLASAGLQPDVSMHHNTFAQFSSGLMRVSHGQFK